MCPVTVTERKVAENDIPVVKMFDNECFMSGKFVSPYFGYRYPSNGLHLCSGDVAIHCTMPKGAEYYEDATGLLVSDTIFIGSEKI